VLFVRRSVAHGAENSAPISILEGQRGHCGVTTG